MFKFFTNSLEMLPLYCNTNCCFSEFSCCFMTTPALYLCPFLFFHSQLVNCILDNVPYPMPRILITFQNFFMVCQCFMERFPIAGGSEQAVYYSLYYVFSYVVGEHSYDISELFQYLMAFDTMCKKCSPPVVR